MKEKLSQTLSQKLQQRLSPLQMRLVRLIEMSEAEAEEEVRAQLDDNPALEIADPGQTAEENSFGETAEELQRADYRSEEEMPQPRFEAYGRAQGTQTFEPAQQAGGESMMEILGRQLAETDIPPEDMPAALYIIGSLDDNGYMTRTLPQIADDLAVNAGVETDPGHLREIFGRVRGLDPAGIGATDLRDCLMLQLKRLPDNADTRLAREIVGHWFDLFSMRHFDRLEAQLGVDREALRRAAEVIRSLDPKPGAELGASVAEDRTRHIIPDFNIEILPGDIISVTMPNNIPELVISESFRPGHTTVPETREGGEARRREALAFITHKREEASDFIELMAMRRRTLMKVMEAIVERQRQFFLTEDESELRPMVLKDISAATGLDISVISRAAAGKYAATEGGIYPLKFFFNERVGGGGAESDGDHSQRRIAIEIKRMVEEEDPSAPLTDEAILDRLRQQGFEIARRTVAKYRDRLGIPVARLRKKI